MQRALASAQAAHVRYVFVTDGKGANPWDRLPAYWDEEVRTIKEIGHNADARR